MASRSARLWGVLLAVGGIVLLARHRQDQGVAVLDQVPQPVDEYELAASSRKLSRLLRYVEDHPGYAEVARAQALIEELRHDETLWLAVQSAGRRDAVEMFLQDFPGHLREPEARALLAEMEPRSVFDLMAEGAVEVTAQGAGIESMTLELQRHAAHEIAVTIPVGTYFLAGGNSQNMVATRATTIRLPTAEPTRASVRVACANRPLPIPHAADRFQMELAPRQHELEALAPVLEAADASMAVAQAAVWIVTDNADYAELGTLILSRDGGISGSRAIREASAVTALKLCADAGLDVSQYALAADELVLFAGLIVPEHGVDAWCRAELERRGFGGTAGEILVGALRRPEQDQLAEEALELVHALAGEAGAAGLRGLADAEPAYLRSRLAKALGRIAAPEDLELLLRLASDPAEAVRVDALEALRSFDPGRTRAGLLQALTDPVAEVAQAGLSVLEQQRDAALVDPLLELVRSGREPWLRANALRALAAQSSAAPARAQEIRNVLAAQLADPEELLGSTALQGLSESLDASLVPALIAITHDTGKDWLRMDAIRALDTIGGPESHAERLRLLDDANEYVVEAALQSLADEIDDAVLRALPALLRHLEWPDLREQAVLMLGETRTAGARAALRELATSPDESVRRTVAEALRSLADPADLELLLSLYSDPSDSVRAAAVGALGVLADDRAQKAVRDVLTDASDEVVDAALWALPAHCGAELLPALESALGNKRSSELRFHLLTTLATCGSAEVPAALWRIFQGARDPGFRESIAQMLVSAADTSLLPALEAAVASEEEPYVRDLLEQALSSLRMRVEAAGGRGR